MKLWFDHFTEKVARYDTSGKDSGRESYTIQMAKNEIEGCHFFLYSLQLVHRRPELSFYRFLVPVRVLFLRTGRREKAGDHGAQLPGQRGVFQGRGLRIHGWDH
jgi:hypothetical protein